VRRNGIADARQHRPLSPTKSVRHVAVSFSAEWKQTRRVCGADRQAVVSIRINRKQRRNRNAEAVTGKARLTSFFIMVR
jgi:hypothetical protein